MMLHIPHVLTRDQVVAIRGELEVASWVDGSATSGVQASLVKRNLQLPRESPEAQRLSRMITGALNSHPLFVSAALPKYVLPPLFNRYEGGGHYGNHVDSAIQHDPIQGGRVRIDLSITVFLCEPEEYAGGELIVEDVYGAHEVKLPAGDAILYPATSLHRVEPVTSGSRLASFLWAQSLVRDDWQRNMLFDLDMTILKLREQLGDTQELVSLTAHYHNLLRQWAES